MATYTNVAVYLGEQDGFGSNPTYTYSATDINTAINNVIPSECKVTRIVIKFRGAKSTSSHGKANITMTLGSYSRTYVEVIANDGMDNNFNTNDIECTSDDIKNYINSSGTASSNGRFSNNLSFALSKGSILTGWRITATIYFDYETPYTVSVSHGAGGDVSPTGGYYYTGDIFTVEARPDAGYKFDGWANSSGVIVSNVNPFSLTISSNIEMIAVFSPLTCKATWKNHDGSVLETDTGISYGTTPTYDGATPVKTNTAKIEYAFSGWSPTPGAITEDVVYTAQFTSRYNSIYAGKSRAKGVYVGNKPAKAIYIGKTKIYEQ